MRNLTQPHHAWLMLRCIHQHLSNQPWALPSLRTGALLAGQAALLQIWLHLWLDRPSAGGCTGCLRASAVWNRLQRCSVDPHGEAAFQSASAASLHFPGCHMSPPPAGAAMMDLCGNSFLPICCHATAERQTLQSLFQSLWSLWSTIPGWSEGSPDCCKHVSSVWASSFESPPSASPSSSHFSSHRSLLFSACCIGSTICLDGDLFQIVKIITIWWPNFMTLILNLYTFLYCNWPLGWTRVRRIEPHYSAVLVTGNVSLIWTCVDLNQLGVPQCISPHPAVRQQWQEVIQAGSYPAVTLEPPRQLSCCEQSTRITG